MIDIFSYKLGQKSGGGGSGGGGGGGGSNEEWIGDGNTHLWISLPEGRTSPMLGVGVNGTVTVDWGDGSTPDVLTGTSASTVQWTPNHAYAKAGDYVITLTVDGEMRIGGVATYQAYGWILRHSSEADARNSVYQTSLRKVEIGNGVRFIGDHAFYSCYGLSSINISDGVSFIGYDAFENCYELSSINIPDSVTSINRYAFRYCYKLPSIVIPSGVTTVDEGLFQDCYCLSEIKIPDGVTSIGYTAFQNCRGLSEIKIPNSVTIINESAFRNCSGLLEIKIPDGVTSIMANTFNGCKNLANVVLGNVTSIGNAAFGGNSGVAIFDFSACATVPTLGSTNAFNGIAADCKIRVPAALVDEWKAATNWSTYADYIVGV